MHRFPLGVALAALSSPLLAQGVGPRLLPAPATPPRPITIDARTGEVTPGPAPEARAVTHALEFENLPMGGFVGVDTGAGGCEWFDAGVKGAGNTSDLFSRADFAYCTFSASGNLTLGFYEGYTPGGGTPTTTVALFALTGLPGTTLGGGFTCYAVRLNVDPLVSFADGPIGYSWGFDAVDPVYPFLACVQSCSGPGPGPFGVIDQLDLRCPPNPAFTPFTFPGFVSSIAMNLYEAADLTASSSPFFGDGINADVLGAPPMILGSPWAPTLAIGHAHGAGGPLSLRVRTGTVNGANVMSPIGGRLTEILINGPLLATILGSHDGVNGTFPALGVPLSPGVYGLGWAGQATVLGGGFADLSTAVAGTAGTQ